MNKCLKLNNFITITFWSNGEYIVLMLSGIGNLIIDDAIAINVILLGMMTMTVKTSHKNMKLKRIKIEDKKKIIIKML